MRVCIPAEPAGVGGTASFYRKLSAGLKAHGIAVTSDLSSRSVDSVLVINGVRRLDLLLRQKRRGVRIVQRLGGLNWTHRHEPIGAWLKFRAGLRNGLMRSVRRFADHVVYQSEFVRSWWGAVDGKTDASECVILNGCDLSLFSDVGARVNSAGSPAVLSVEGTLGIGPSNLAVDLTKLLRQRFPAATLRTIGKRLTPEAERPETFVENVGVVPNDRLPEFYRASDLFIATDVIAACPNSAIEALACGLPVVGFSEGALPEIVSPRSGKLVPYGGNPFRWQPPRLEPLVDAAVDVVAASKSIRTAARLEALERFDLRQMVASYIRVLARD